MCGRFVLITSAEQLAQQFGVSLVEQPSLPSLAPRYNIAPTQDVAAVRLARGSGERELALLHWGLIPSWAKDMKIGSRMINARSETITDKPSFRAAFRKRRCLIPADGFYEWQRQGDKKQPLYIHQNDNTPFALAGLWETWKAPDGTYVDSCTILTTEPNEFMRPIHNRMPVILEAADHDMWLHPEPDPEVALHLLRPYPSEKLSAYPVSTLVNSPGNDDPHCIAPLAE